MTTTNLGSDSTAIWRGARSSRPMSTGYFYGLLAMSNAVLSSLLAPPMCLTILGRGVVVVVVSSCDLVMCRSEGSSKATVRMAMSVAWATDSSATFASLFYRTQLLELKIFCYYWVDHLLDWSIADMDLILLTASRTDNPVDRSELGGGGVV